MVDPFIHILPEVVQKYAYCTIKHKVCVSNVYVTWVNRKFVLDRKFMCMLCMLHVGKDLCKL